MILHAAKTHELLVTIEENAIMGGAGSAVTECLSKHHQLSPALQLGLPDLFIEHGDHKQMLASCGLDAEGMIKSVRAYGVGVGA